MSEEVSEGNAVPVRKIGWTAVTSAVARAASIVSNFVVIPLALAYLGKESFGLIATITSLVALLIFLDLGVGNALMNVVAGSSGKTYDSTMLAAVVMAYRLALVIFVIGLVIASLILIWPPESIAKIFGISSEQLSSELPYVLGVFIVLLTLGVPASLAQRIQMGKQQGYWANLWQAGGSLISLIAVLAAIRLDTGILGILLAMVGGGVIAQILNSILFFLREQGLLKALFTFRTTVEADFLRKSFGFLGLQVIAALTFHSGPAIISYLNGASQTVEYAVAFRLYSIPSMITGFITVAIWPAYSHAHSRGDTSWIRIRFIQTLFITVIVAGTFAFCIYFLRDRIVEIWLNDLSIVSQDTHFAFLIQSIVTIFSANFAALLNGVGVIRFQLWTSAAMAIFSVAASIMLTPIVGPAGPVWSATVGLIIFVLMPSSLIIFRMLGRDQ